ncbi:H-NS histone family protein [Paracidovorax citrulli]
MSTDWRRALPLAACQHAYDCEAADTPCRQTLAALRFHARHRSDPPTWERLDVIGQGVSETWTGRGRQPRWVAGLVNSGKPAADFLIIKAEDRAFA